MEKIEHQIVWLRLCDWSKENTWTSDNATFIHLEKCCKKKTNYINWRKDLQEEKPFVTMSLLLSLENPLTVPGIGADRSEDIMSV